MAPLPDPSPDTAGTTAPTTSGVEQRVLETIDDEETLGLLRGLIARPSENPPGNEGDCARFLASYLEERGVACRLAELMPGRPNLYAAVGSSGGRGGSTVADVCRLTLDRRVLPSEDLDEAEAEVRNLLRRLELVRPGLSWELSRTLAFPPLRGTNTQHLEEVLNAAAVDLGGSVYDDQQGMRFATDAAWYAAAGRPSVVFGPGDVAIAHGPDEYVRIDDLHVSTRVLLLSCLRLLA